jgi:hypothetical protein
MHMGHIVEWNHITEILISIEPTHRSMTFIAFNLVFLCFSNIMISRNKKQSAITEGLKSNEYTFKSKQAKALINKFFVLDLGFIMFIVSNNKILRMKPRIYMPIIKAGILPMLYTKYVRKHIAHFCV